MSRKSRSSNLPSRKESGTAPQTVSDEALLRWARPVLAATGCARLTVYLRHFSSPKLTLEANRFGAGTRNVTAPSELDAVEWEAIFQQWQSKDFVAVGSKHDAYPKLQQLFAGSVLPAQVWLFPFWEKKALLGWVCLEFRKASRRLSAEDREAVAPLLNVINRLLYARQNQSRARGALICGELEKTESTKRSLFENETSGVAVLDAKWKVVAVDSALCRLLQQPEKALVGESASDFMVPESFEVVRDAFQGIKRERKLSRHAHMWVKLTLLRKDLSTVDVKTFLTVITDENARFTRTLAFFPNLTRLADEREKLTQLNEAVIANSPTCIVLTDPHGIVVRVNPAVEALTGYPARHFIGKCIWDTGVVAPQDLNAVNNDWRNRLLKGKRVQGSIRVLGRAGQLRYIDGHATMVRTPEGKPLWVVLNAVDVTERKRLEEEVVKIAEETQVRIGHDLHDGVGQVLTGVISLTEALEGRLVGAELGEAVRIRGLLREAMEQVRDLSHMLAPAVVKDRGLATALHLLSKQIKHPGLECEFQMDAEPKLDDPTKETHLFRIAQEAINNAVKHGKPKRISLSLKRLSGNCCLMLVQDDGTGIHPRKTRPMSGIGVSVMGYRAGLVGGQLELKAGDKGGTVVACRFPCAY
ncbi:MAG: PAS domain S-box protein [Verrucomicrobiaceae bacterium]|nr:PAS domain S-box protein [Verrucomicrobiaceae bacterium]